MQHRRAVVEPLTVLFRIADHQSDAVDPARQFIDGIIGLRDKVGAQQQVFGRIADDDLFGKNNQVGAQFVAGVDGRLPDGGDIGRNVADREIDLRDGDF